MRKIFLKQFIAIIFIVGIALNFNILINFAESDIKLSVDIERIKGSYDFIFNGGNNLYRVNKGGKVNDDFITGGKWGFIDENGEIVIPLEYDGAILFSNGFSPVSKNGRWGIIDKNNNVIIPFDYSFAFYGGENRFIVSNDKKDIKITKIGGYTVPKENGIVDSNNKVIVPLKYDKISKSSEGLFPVISNNKAGFIDVDGNIVIPFEYDNCFIFSEGLAMVVKGKKYGFIDNTGKLVIPMEFDYSGYQTTFRNGYYSATKNNNFGVIDKTGKTILDFKYQYVYQIEDNFVVVNTGGNTLSYSNLGGKWGVVDFNGKAIIPIEYDNIEYNGKLLLAKKEGKYGILNKKGETVIGFDYDDLEILSDSNAIGLIGEKTFKISLVYKYDEVDIGKNVNVGGLIDGVSDESSAKNIISNLVTKLSEELKKSATGIDRLTLLTEEVIAKIASKNISDSNFIISNSIVEELVPLAINTAKALDNTLTTNGVNIQREFRKTITIKTDTNSKVNVKKEAVKSSIDTVKIQAPYIGVSIPANNASALSVEKKGDNKVSINFDAKKENTVKLSFPNIKGDVKYKAVVDENGKAVGGKYNPVTGDIEARVSKSGIYTVIDNEKNFSDIKDKSVEMQEAIKLLASKGIINGTSATEFSPDNSINRAEIAALIVRTLSKLDPNEDGGFKDVSKQNWYFGVAGSSKKHGIIKGFPDNTFKGENVIAKDQITAVSARVLKNEMKYKVLTGADIEKYLTYEDKSNIADWAKSDISLASMANLVLKRVDGNFNSNDEMTRGDAAIMLARLFEKIW